MSNLEELVKIRDKFIEIRKKYGFKTNKALIYALNKLPKEQENDYMQERIFSNLKQVIKKNRKVGMGTFIKYKMLEDALDKFISIQNKKFIQYEDVYNYISEQLNRNLFQLNTHFTKHEYYFIIRRAYSANNYIAVSLIKFTYDKKNNITTYRTFRYSDTFNAYYVSNGGVFVNSINTLAISGIAKHKDASNPYAPKIMEHIYLNISTSDFEAKNIFDGLYLGCCAKNNSLTPFCTRISLLPISNDLITKNNQDILEKFSFSFHIDDISNDFDMLKRYVKDTHQNHQCHEVGFDILRKSMERLDITMQDVCERITCKIDDRDSFGGLREFSFFE